MTRGLLAAIRARLLLWLGLTLGFVAGYHLLLLGLMVARFGHWPNFAKSYDVLDSWRVIISGTPSWSDALSISLSEPLLEIGYLSPQWRIAEWSLMILPRQLAQVTLLGCLLAAFVVLWNGARGGRRPGAARGAWLACAAGAGLCGTTSATLFWVAHCTTPTWVLALEMLGLGASLAATLEPAGPMLAIAGFGLLAGSVTAQLRRLAGSAPARDAIALGVTTRPSTA